jgi:hypothetical protein
MLFICLKMKIKLYRENGALGSAPIFDALEAGFRRLGHTIVNDNEDIPVIWSVLWFGRMQNNQWIYNNAKKNNKPVMIVEVGALKRGITWKLSLENINAHGTFNKDGNFQNGRSKKLGIILKEPLAQRYDSILLLGQHDKSLQWQGQLPVREWAMNKIAEIRKYSSRPIIVRPHPRCNILPFDAQGVKFEKALPLADTYSEFDIRFAHHAVVNHNSGTTVQAAIAGAPVVCDPSALAYPVSTDMPNVEIALLPDRTTWFEQMLHTEWLVDELADGYPIKRLLSAD